MCHTLWHMSEHIGFLISLIDSAAIRFNKFLNLIKQSKSYSINEVASCVVCKQQKLFPSMFCLSWSSYLRVPHHWNRTWINGYWTVREETCKNPCGSHFALVKHIQSPLKFNLINIVWRSTSSRECSKNILI